MEKIVEHQDWAQVPYRRLLAEAYGQQGWGPLPPDSQIIGTVNAYVNHGRWIAECPVSSCGGAVIADPVDLLFICYQCGKGWYNVIFPPFKTGIERLLLLRPRVGNHPKTRNWLPTQTLADLIRENQEEGIN